MVNLKFVVWNMEWLNDLFDAGPKCLPDDQRTQHNKRMAVAQRREDLIGVLNHIDPDIVVIIEGPNNPDELQFFFQTKSLRGDWETDLQPSGAQSIGIACRTDTRKFETQAIHGYNKKESTAFKPFTLDVDVDGVKEVYEFSRWPLYAEVRPKDGQRFRVLGLHLKSKGIFDALGWSAWWRKADANRRKILAEANQVRKAFIEPYFRNEQTREIPLLVCGDINDGPGMDASERKLGASGIERLMGSVWKPTLVLRNALFDALQQEDQIKEDFRSLSTTRFKDPIINNTYHRVWIDHILYSNPAGSDPWVHGARIVKTVTNDEKIWKEFPKASDHQPVVATLTV